MVPSKRCQAALRTTEVIMKLALVICLARVNSRNSCLLPPTLSFVISRPPPPIPPLPRLPLISSSPSAALSYAFLSLFVHLFYLFPFSLALFSANRKHPPSFLPHLPPRRFLRSALRLLCPASLFQPPPPSFFSLPASSLPAYCLNRSARLRRLIASPPRLPNPPGEKAFHSDSEHYYKHITHLLCRARMPFTARRKQQ